MRCIRKGVQQPLGTFAANGCAMGSCSYGIIENFI